MYVRVCLIIYLKNYYTMKNRLFATPLLLTCLASSFALAQSQKGFEDFPPIIIPPIITLMQNAPQTIGLDKINVKAKEALQGYNR
jgi:hypothetical protein